MMLEDNVQSLAPRKPIGLALQGGGSWGAYTWGVLDAVLAAARLSIAHLSGTSAGAINGAIVASALAKGSPAARAQGAALVLARHRAPGGRGPRAAGVGSAGARMARFARDLAHLERLGVAV